ncbi:MAG TPA: aquaporin [Candidatus Dependentiae bacterium]|nr:aquaporin [Candidatus Dependentiae bacterium]HRQ62778.1 aquaporin [Candidatus Dependentiae bacterium]
MRQYLMELIGTLLLTLAIAGGDPMAVGLVLMAAVYFGAHISGAHYNPAVTTADIVRGKMDIFEGIKYVVSQLIGALLALWLYGAATGNIYGVDGVAMGGVGMAVVMEIILAGLFVWAVLQLVFSKKLKGNTVYGLVVGLTFAAVIMLGGKINPAVTGSVLVNDLVKGAPFGDINNILVYILAPLVGGGVAALLFEYLNPGE